MHALARTLCHRPRIVTIHTGTTSDQTLRIIFCPLYGSCASNGDVSGNSLFGLINRDLKSMVADGGALITLAHNFFFGDAVLFAAGCKVCPTEVNEPNNLDMWNISKWMVGGKCNDALVNNSIMGAGREVRVSLSGNYLTLSPNVGCSSHATQRSTAACKALCSITANGPCDGHGECVQPDPASPSKFACLCHAGYTAVNLDNGSTCAIIYSNTTTGNPHFILTCCTNNHDSVFLQCLASSLQHYLILAYCTNDHIMRVLATTPYPSSPHLNSSPPTNHRPVSFNLLFLGSVLSVHRRHSEHYFGQLCWLHAAGFCGRMVAVAPWTKGAGCVQAVLAATDAEGNQQMNGGQCAGQGWLWNCLQRPLATGPAMGHQALHHHDQ
ncbi:unnamed protein product [Closterium sp. NIES-54]